MNAPKKLHGLAAALLLCATWSGAARAQTPADVDTARELFREGTTAATAHDWPLAREKLGKSLLLRWSALTLFQLAVAQRESGHLVQALESFRGFVASPQSEKSQPLLPEARGAIDELQARVGRLTLRLHPIVQGVETRVDGEVVPAAALGESRIVDPGHRTIRLTAPGHVPLETEIDIVEGASVDLELHLVPLGATVAPRRTEAAAMPVATEQGPSNVLPVSLMIGGVVVASAGVAIGIAGLARADGAVDGSEDAEAGRAMGYAADVMAPTGAVAAGIGALLYFLAPSSGGDSDRAATLSPWSSGSVAGARMQF